MGQIQSSNTWSEPPTPGRSVNQMSSPLESQPGASMSRRQQKDYFAEWLRRTMANRGISGGEVARALNVNDSAVSRWRNGKATPGLESCQTLAEYLKVDPIRLAVTAGLLKPEVVKSEALPLPADTAQRRFVREQISKIPGLTGKERARLLEAYDDEQ